MTAMMYMTLWQPIKHYSLRALFDTVVVTRLLGKWETHKRQHKKNVIQMSEAVVYFVNQNYHKSRVCR